MPQLLAPAVENRFGHDYNDLPLEKFCATAERELLALIAARGVAAATAAQADPHLQGGDGRSAPISSMPKRIAFI